MLLSRRESQVVELMGKGLSRAEISDRLGVSRKCVSVFIERARGKFHLKTALKLRHLAFRLASFTPSKRFEVLTSDSICRLPSELSRLSPAKETLSTNHRP